MKVACPDCKREIELVPTAKYEDNTELTVAYKMKEGHAMPVRDFAKSITGLADGLIITGRHLGAKVEVFITDLKVENSSIEITVKTVLVDPKKSAVTK